MFKKNYFVYSARKTFLRVLENFYCIHKSLLIISIVMYTLKVTSWTHNRVISRCNLEHMLITLWLKLMGSLPLSSVMLVGKRKISYQGS